jgi:hypothetical protein
MEFKWHGVVIGKSIHLIKEEKQVLLFAKATHKNELGWTRSTVFFPSGSEEIYVDTVGDHKHWYGIGFLTKGFETSRVGNDRLAPFENFSPQRTKDLMQTGKGRLGPGDIATTNGNDVRKAQEGATIKAERTTGQ